MNRTGPVQADGSMTPAAMILLHAVSGVDKDLLHAAHIRPSRTNWLRAPWYPYHRGGAITVGRTIWFTRIWFDPKGYGDGSLRSCWKWLLHLAHEVGHLPQAEHFGRSFPGKARYVAAFALQYATRALLLKSNIHDGSRLEQEADLGRAVLLHIVGDQAETHPLVAAVYRNDAAAVQAWFTEQRAELTNLHLAYRKRMLV